MMGIKTIELEIDPDIDLGDSVDDMPDQIKGGLLIMITRAAKKHNCHWKQIAWTVEFVDNQPIIKVRKK